MILVHLEELELFYSGSDAGRDLFNIEEHTSIMLEVWFLTVRRFFWKINSSFAGKVYHWH